MKLQVLVSTMDQIDKSLLDKMNIQSDAIIVNQANYNKIEEFRYDENIIKYISLQEKGIGLSRNTALMRANSDICLFADDDLIYIDNYKEIVITEFIRNPEADIILFNVPSLNKERPTNIIKKEKRLRWYNSLKYGAVKVAIRTDSMKKANIMFSLLFGGGAKYSAGEDSLFIAECLRKGLKLYANPKIIGYVSQEESSWFKGYNEKYFFDKGAFFACLSAKWAKILCLQFLVRHRNIYKQSKSAIEVYKLMMSGIEDILNKKK